MISIKQPPAKEQSRVSVWLAMVRGLATDPIIMAWYVFDVPSTVKFNSGFIAFVDKGTPRFQVAIILKLDSTTTVSALIPLYETPTVCPDVK